MLSGIVITKNEEKNIVSCLSNLQRVADEIIVVDSFSADKTVKEARKYTDKIYHKKFTDNFSSQRNHALQKAKFEWVIFLDADELLSKRLINIIPNLIKETYFKGYLIPRRNYIDEKTWLKFGVFYPDYQLRLFKKRGVKYTNRVHEYPNIDNKLIKKINPYIIHRAVHTKYNSFSSISRLDKYTTIKAKELFNNRKSTIQILINNIYQSFDLFTCSFVTGKGYKDKWNGFRAASIFSLFPLLVIYKYLKMKLKSMRSRYKRQKYL